jgi:hypothetical protein
MFETLIKLLPVESIIRILPSLALGMISEFDVDAVITDKGKIQVKKYLAFAKKGSEVLEVTVNALESVLAGKGLPEEATEKLEAWIVGKPTPTKVI